MRLTARHIPVSLIISYINCKSFVILEFLITGKDLIIDLFQI